MTGSHQRVSGFDDAEHTYVLTRQLELFLDAWESSAEPPSLADFIPPQEDCRRLALAELIKVDLEYRWQQRNIPKRIGEYLQEFPELAEGGVPVDLIYEEFHIRRNCGFQVEPREYLEQFPDQADELQRLLGLEQSYQTTSMFGGKAKRRLDEIEVGQQLDDFELVSVLGAGNFARVFLARQRSMQRMVALKVSADSGSEPQTLAQFDHDYIVRVFDTRVMESRRLRLLYMQYVAGGTLQQVVRLVRETDPIQRGGALLLRAVHEALDNRGEIRPSESAVAEKLAAMSWPEVVCWIGSRLASALDYAHRRGVLHRDVKPANVLLSAEGVPKLADFNISFCSKLSGATPAAYFGGSLAYMSPEQLEACNPNHSREPESLDARSDLYALGVVLWELLAGSRPFNDTQAEGGWSKTLTSMTARRKIGLTDETLAQLPADCPPGLVRNLTKCLAPQPKDRWASGQELARQLEFGNNRQVQELLHPPSKTWKSRFGKWPVLIIFLAAGIPNGLAGWFNYEFNEEMVKTNLADVLPDFERIQLVINLTAYPVSFSILVFLASMVVRESREMRQGGNVEPKRLRTLRWLALSLGHLTAWLGAFIWMLAGIAYPISIHLAAGHMPKEGYIQFSASLLLCGLIAASYPFFGVTYIGLGVLYPGLLLDDLSASDDVPTLKRLRRQSLYYLIIAATVPLLSILALVAFESFMVINRAHFLIALVALSTGGLFGFGLLFWRYRLLQRDLDVLIDALAPRA
ncbi:MAG: serine/threonine-protein kinase [Planctomycetaceae bacterium]